MYWPLTMRSTNKLTNQNQWEATCNSHRSDWKVSISSGAPTCFVIHFNIVLFIRLLLSSGFPTKILHTFFISPMRATCLTYLVLLYLIIVMLYAGEHKSWNSSLCVILHSPPKSSIFNPKHSSHYAVLKHPQPAFFSLFMLRNRV